MDKKSQIQISEAGAPVWSFNLPEFIESVAEKRYTNQ